MQIIPAVCTIPSAAQCIKQKAVSKQVDCWTQWLYDQAVMMVVIAVMATSPGHIAAVCFCIFSLDVQVIMIIVICTCCAVHFSILHFPILHFPMLQLLD